MCWLKCWLNLIFEESIAWVWSVDLMCVCVAFRSVPVGHSGSLVNIQVGKCQGHSHFVGEVHYTVGP